MLLHHNWKWVLRPPWSLRHVHIQLWGVGLGRWGRMRNWGYCELVCSFFGLSWLWIFYFIHLQAVFVAAIQQACGASHLGVDHHWASAHCSHCTYCTLHIANRILHIANRILHIAHCTLHIAHYTLHIANCSFWCNWVLVPPPVDTLFSPGDTSLEASALLSWEAGGEGTGAPQQVVAQRGSPQKRSSWLGCL